MPSFIGRGRKDSAPDVAALVENMFADVLTPSERQDLLARIEAWEAANPGLSSAERITGWIDVAYEYQAEKGPTLPDPD